MLTHYGMTDGKGAQDQRQKQTQHKVQQDLIKLATEASDPHHEPNKLPDQVHQALKSLDFSSQIFTSLNDTYQTLTETSPNLSCWLCLPLRTRPFLAQPIPSKGIEAQNLTRNATKVTWPMGPMTTEVMYLPANASCFLAKDTSLTTVACDGSRRGPLSPNPPICGKSGIFFLCNQTALLQCFPPNWTQPCTPVFLTPYLTILTPQAMEDQIRPTHRRRRALAAAPLLLGGGLFTASGLGVGGLGAAPHFYYKLSADLN